MSYRKDSGDFSAEQVFFRATQLLFGASNRLYENFRLFFRIG